MSRPRAGDEGAGRPGRRADPADPSASLILPGGMVSADAVRAAAELEQLGADPDATEPGPGEDDGLRRVRFKLTRDLQKRLDKYLTDRIPFMSRTQLQRLIDNEGVQVNGRTPKASTVLRIGDVVDVVVPPPPPKEIQPENIPLSVLYEDEDLIVLNKSPDIIVHPARSHLSGTMVNALAWHFQNASITGGGLSTVGGEFARPGVVHRLDRHTSGVVVFAKRDEAHWRLGRQFEHRQVDKRYLAVSHGVIEPYADVIDLPIGPHPSSVKGQREKNVVRHDELGRASVTIYRVRERYEGYSLVELELKTGRTHQIRVHLSHLGWPIAGDDMYGGKRVRAAELDPSLERGEAEVVAPRQMLHAALLSFLHPTTGQKMTFQAPLPGDMLRLVRELRAHRGGRRVDVAGATLDLERIAPA